MLNKRSLPPHGDGQLVECERSGCSDPAFLFRLRLWEGKGWAWGTVFRERYFVGEEVKKKELGGGSVGKRRWRHIYLHMVMALA